MKTIIYFILTIMGFIGSVTGIIRLGSYGISSVDTSIMYSFIYTLVSMGVFIFFSYVFAHSYKDFINKLKN